MIETDQSAFNEKDKQGLLRAEAREIKEALRVLSGLQKTKGWQFLMEKVAPMLTQRENYAIYYGDSDLAGMDLDRAVLRGEAAGMRLIMSLPAIIIQQYQVIHDEYQDEGLLDGD